MAQAATHPPGTGARESRPGYLGWRVVLACFAMAVFSWTLGFYGQGVYLAELHRIHGWPIAGISTATTAYYLLSAALVVFVGDLIARFGARRSLVVGVTCLAAAGALAGQVRELWQLYAVYLFMSVGWAATGVAAITTTIGLHFQERRGLAISLALNGASAGGIVGVPVLVAAIDLFGFGSGLAVVAGGATLLLVPLLLLLVPSRPPLPASPGAVLPGSARGSERVLALRSFAFWTITGPFAAALFVQVGFIVHQFPLLEPIAGAKIAGLIVSLTAAAAVIGRVGLGSLIDRIDPRRASAGALLLQAVALAIAARAEALEPLVLASVLFGLSVGNVITLPALIVHREFEPRAFATIVALSTAIGQLVYAFGPGALGWLREFSGGYGLPLALCAVIDLAAAGAVLLGRGGRGLADGVDRSGSSG